MSSVIRGRHFPQDPVALCPVSLFLCERPDGFPVTPILVFPTSHTALNSHTRCSPPFLRAISRWKPPFYWTTVLCVAKNRRFFFFSVWTKLPFFFRAGALRYCRLKPSFRTHFVFRFPGANTRVCSPFGGCPSTIGMTSFFPLVAQWAAAPSLNGLSLFPDPPSLPSPLKSHESRSAAVKVSCLLHTLRCRSLVEDDTRVIVP